MPEITNGSMQLTSTAFSAGQQIPQVHAYDEEGENVSPPLAWGNVPPGTAELALICDDPDAPQEDPWVHWVVYRLPKDTRGIGQNASQGGTLREPVDAIEGKNDFGELGWGGPLPPEGHGTHHYRFRLYALDEPLEAMTEAGAVADNLRRAMDGHVLAETELVGTYER